MFSENYTIGSFCFRMDLPDEICPPENFLKFRGGENPEYTYAMTLSRAFPEPQDAVLLNRPDLLVTGRDGLECRWLKDGSSGRVYACVEESSATETKIRFDSDRLAELVWDPLFVSLLALERRQMERDAMILHCAYVEYEGEAILFSAPSETGKTTQANLWEKYRGAKTVNGDRSLLRRIDGRWHACGWPVCGSSGVCHNKALPIRAIVMLSQAPQDRAERMGAMKAFTQIYSQITVNRWNRRDTQRAMELLEDLVANVPVYHLACTMEETAVQALEAVLK